MIYPATYRVNHGFSRLPAVRHAESACRPTTRPDHRGAGGADLLHDVVRIPRHRRSRGLVQPGGAGPHLQPHLQPDRRRARRADCCLGRWRRRGMRRQWHGRVAPGRRHAAERRRPHRRLEEPVRRVVQHDEPDAAPVRDHHDIRRPPRPGAFAAAIQPNTKLVLRRDARQPRHRGDGRAGNRRCRPRPRPAADGRLDVLDALPVPTDRARRRHRDAFGDQVPRRPRHRARRGDRRRRSIRLDGERQVPHPHRALRRVPRHRLRRGVRAVGARACEPGPRGCATSGPA